MAVNPARLPTSLTEAPQARPARPTVPLWVKDEQWDVWHIWPIYERLSATGETRTLCGDEFTWTPTVVTSYHVLEAVGCYLCRLALEGTPVPRRGRRRHLPGGPGQTQRASNAPQASRRARAIEQGATVKVYTTPTGGTSQRAVPTPTMKARMAAEDVAWAGTFEVGTRLQTSPCPFCGQSNVGAAFCSAWCQREWNREAQDDKHERSGRRMAKRHFLEQLYGVKRRDTITSWTPPVRQIRQGAGGRTDSDNAMLYIATNYI